MFVLITKAVAAYALGSMSGSLLLGRRQGFDIRESGSGNAGGTNALRTRGWKFALGVVAIDISKGALAVWLALLIPTTEASPGLYVEALACGFAAVLGHVFPVYYGFRGGKGAATVVGTIAVLCPIALAPLLLIWLLVLGSTGYVGLSTVVAGLSLVPLVWWLAPQIGSLHTYALACAALLVLTHVGNLWRLYRGTERRFERARVLARLFEERR
jgi:acyl phosphate:glycerol-3-phosphate acyltransferase